MDDDGAGHLLLELPRTNQAPDIARRWLVKSFAGELDSLAEQNAKLLVSELVTNAVVHGRGRLEIRARLDGDRLVVDVIDEGPGFTPTLREPDPETPGGCGLRIVDKLASRWGVRQGAAHVWFELPQRRVSTNGRNRRAQRAALYRRVADTLERSADLAEQHAEREHLYGHRHSAHLELERVKRAREAARQGRSLASQLP